MKNFLFATAAAFALMAAPVFAGPTENITGCATVPVQGSNYTVRVDPHCALSTDQPDGDFMFSGLRAAAPVWGDEDELDQ